MGVFEGHRVLPPDKNYHIIAFISCKELDWMGGVYREGGVYKGICRLRFYKDNKTHNSNDEKKWMKMEETTNRNEAIEIMRRTLLTLKKKFADQELAIVDYSFKEFDNVPFKEALEWMMTKSWCHSKTYSSKQDMLDDICDNEDFTSGPM